MHTAVKIVCTQSINYVAINQNVIIGETKVRHGKRINWFAVVFLIPADSLSLSLTLHFDGIAERTNKKTQTLALSNDMRKKTRWHPNFECGIFVKTGTQIAETNRKLRWHTTKTGRKKQSRKKVDIVDKPCSIETLRRCNLKLKYSLLVKL